MKFTFDSTVLMNSMTPEHWVILVMAAVIIAREAWLFKPLKRLRLMDSMNMNMIKKIHPRGEMLDQTHVNKMFMDAFGPGGDGRMELGKPDPDIGSAAESAKKVLEKIIKLREVQEAATSGTEIASGATVVIPDEQVSNFLAHIEIDGFSGSVKSGPMPSFSTITVPVTGPDKMQPLTNSIASWEKMRKDVENN